MMVAICHHETTAGDLTSQTHMPEDLMGCKKWLASGKQHLVNTESSLGVQSDEVHL